MVKSLIAFAAIVAAVLAGGPHPDAGPHGALDGATCSEVGEIHVDSQNMCWFHLCVNDGAGTAADGSAHGGNPQAAGAGATPPPAVDEYGNPLPSPAVGGATATGPATAGPRGALKMLPRRCALGSKVSYNYIVGFANPCTINFDSTYGYECMRTKPSVDGPPACFNDLVCHNGGTKTFEADKCWCLCPLSWQGDFDCSKPTRDVTDLAPASDICVGGEPLDDWCKINDGCMNGGTCFNQCDSFYCLCPEHEKYNYKGKRCEDM